MHRSRYLLVFLGAFIVPALASDAGAQSVPAASPTAGDVQTDKARELHLEADGFYKKGEYAKARASYLAAWALKKHWQIAGSLADCEVRLGLDRDAAEHFAYYFRHVPKGQTPPANAKKLYAEAKSRIGAITLQVSEPGADVKVDGVLVGTSPIEDPVFVAPGKHTVEVRLGAKSARMTLDANAGVTASASLEMKSEAPLPVPTASATTTAMVVSTAAPRSKVPAFVMGGVAVVGAAVGIGLFVAWGEKRGAAQRTADSILLEEHSCVTGAANFDARCPDVESMTRASTSLKFAGTGTLIGAGLLTAGAAAYFFWSAAPSSPSAKSAVRITPAASNNGATVMVSGKW